VREKTTKKKWGKNDTTESQKVGKKDTTATQQETAHYQHPLLNPSTYFKQ